MYIFSLITISLVCILALYAELELDAMAGINENHFNRNHLKHIQSQGNQ